MLSVSGCDSPGWLYGGGGDEWIAEVCHQNNQPKLQGVTPILWAASFAGLATAFLTFSKNDSIYFHIASCDKAWGRGSLKPSHISM